MSDVCIGEQRGRRRSTKTCSPRSESSVNDYFLVDARTSRLLVSLDWLVRSIDRLDSSISVRPAREHDCEATLPRSFSFRFPP